MLKTGFRGERKRNNTSSYVHTLLLRYTYTFFTRYSKKETVMIERGWNSFFYSIT